MDRAGHDQRFRRARLARFADDDTLDRLEAEHAELSIDEQRARNERIDTLSDVELLAELDVPAQTDAGDDVDGKPKRTRRSGAADGERNPE